MSGLTFRLQRGAAGSTSTQDLANILVGKQFTSDVGDSTDEPGNPVSFITDQDPSTRWISLPQSPVNLTVDMVGVYTLTKLVITWAADTIKNYQVQVSTNGTSWTTISSGATNNTKSQIMTISSFSGVAKGRYLRIVGVDRWNTDYGNSIWEVEAYGVADTSTPVGTISNFRVTASSATSINLAWDYSGSALTNFTLKQGSTTISSPAASARSFSHTGLTAGTTYNYTIVGNFTGGGTTNVATKSSTTSGGTSERLVPLIGKSGLPFNLVYFGDNRSGAANWLGHDLDGMLAFSSRGSLSEIQGSLSWHETDAVPGGLRIISIPGAPDGQDNSATASGSNNSFWQSYGQSLADMGWNSNLTIIRLNWENNGDWYSWSNDRPSVASFIAAWRNVVTSIRSNAPNVLFDWCGNRGPSQSGHWSDAYPGDAYVDIIGLDDYDHWPPAYDQATFDSKCDADPGLNSVVAMATQHNKMWALDEWGCVHSDNGGGDNPTYIQMMRNYIAAHQTNCAYINWYNDPGAPSTFHHELYPTNYNPNAAALFKQIF